MGQRSAHFAICLLFYLETYLSDYQKKRGQPTNSVRISNIMKLILDEISRLDSLIICPSNVKALILGMASVAASVTAPLALGPMRQLSILHFNRLQHVSSHNPIPHPSLEDLFGGRAFSSGSSSLSSYYKAQMAFIGALVEICDRLSKFDRTSRQKALQAELNLLNHNLPADVCIPFWCSGKHFHDRVVRISPVEAVVLNSAERAPYLIMVEMIQGEEDPEESLPSESNFSYLENEDVSESAGSSLDLAISEESLNDFSERMRTAAILLVQLHRRSMVPNLSTQEKSFLERIRANIIEEMEHVENERRKGVGISSYSSYDNNLRFFSILAKEDPSALVLKESFRSKVERIKSSSPFGSHKRWKIASLIVKCGSDLRQEMLAVQIIKEILRIWDEAGVHTAWLLYFRILVTSANSGLIETISDAISLHTIKKQALLTCASISNSPNTSASVRSEDLDVDVLSNPSVGSLTSSLPKPESSTFNFSLLDYFILKYGPVDSTSFKEAQEAFLQSLVGYSILTYILALKDRHNGNILLDARGHLIHIDFGFMLSNSPGYVGFESAPFKLTEEYVDVLGGQSSPLFLVFKERFIQAFLLLRKHSDRILMLVEMMMKDSPLPCFYSGGDVSVYHLRERFLLSYTDQQVSEYVDKLISASYANIFTRLYDSFQYYSNGIL